MLIRWIVIYPLDLSGVETVKREKGIDILDYIYGILRSSGELRGEYKHVLTFFHFSDHCVVYTCFECSLIFIFEPACSILCKRAQD